MEPLRIPTGELVADYEYTLPESLIASQPLPERTASRLLVIGRGQPMDSKFTQLPELLQPGDLLVLNDTQVIPARLLGHKHSGAKVELLLERFTGAHSALVHIKTHKTVKTGTVLHFKHAATETEWMLTVTNRDGELFSVHSDRPVRLLFESCGHIPLPPYLHRPPVQEDAVRYQTVFAQTEGAVAAPTAGLHFDWPLLQQLKSQGIHHAFITLHVGSATFKPVRVDQWNQHIMHAEAVCVPPVTVAAITATKAQGGRVVAVGSTCVRALETAALSGTLQPFKGESTLFIQPGFAFQVVDKMISNFHLPRSTLLVMVAAFSGYAEVMQAYHHAIDQRYRFFSYGDACLLEPGSGRRAF